MVTLPTTNQSAYTAKQLERTKQTAGYFRITPMTLWRWRQCPTFPQPLKRGRIVLYDVPAIEQWLSEGVQK